MRLEGYLVSQNSTINFPVLGELSVKEKTTQDLENDIKKLLVDGGYLINPNVTVRLLNAKGYHTRGGTTARHFYLYRK